MTKEEIVNGRVVIDISENKDIYKMPLIKGDYYYSDIGIMKLIPGEIHVFCKQYREVRWGKGIRKIDKSDVGINIPIEIIDEFVSVIQELKTKK